MELQIFSGSANEPLAKQIADSLSMSLGDVEFTRFPDGELLVKYTQNIRGSDVFIVQPTCSPPAENMMQLLVMLDAARRASAQRVTAVLPFYGYARQDRKDQPRVPITAKLAANLLVTAGADRVLTVDLHSQQVQGFFDIPVDHLYAAPVLMQYLNGVIGKDSVVVAPDSGGVKMAHSYSTAMETGLAIVAKRRVSAEEVSTMHLVGDVEGRDCVLVDDVVTTAGTLCGAAEKLRKAGAERIFAAVSHCNITEKGNKRLQESSITQLVTSDSVPCEYAEGNDQIKVLSVAGLLAEAIRRIHENQSVSSLFRMSK